MAKSKGGESNAVLIIVMVFFILLSLILAVTTYMGYASANDQFKQAEEAKTKQTASENELQKAKFEKTVYKISVMPADSDDQATMAGALSGQKETFDRVQNATKKDLTWEAAKDEKGFTRPARSYGEVCDDLRKQLQVEKDKVANLEKGKKEADNKLSGVEDNARKGATDYLAKLKSLGGELVDLRKKQSKDYLDSLSALEDRDGKVKALQEMAVKDKEATDKAIAKLNESIAALERKLQKTQAETGVSATKFVDLLEYDRPKGKIVRIERTGTTVYINLGSSDRVKPGLTFSVFASDKKSSQGEPKGAVEVIEVINERLSSAKVMTVGDANNDPLVPGDQLFNPAWDPNMREHVAIAGFIDLTGDGRDGTKEFIRNLEAQGIVIDAYLDLRDMSVKGKGLNENTSYLIIGSQPDIDAAFQLGEGGSDRAERAKELITKIGEMRLQANKLGVTIVPVRRFMALTGYRVPRNAFTSQTGDFSSPYLRPSQPEPKPAEPVKPPEKNGPKDKDKDAPKDKDKDAPKDKGN